MDYERRYTNVGTVAVLKGALKGAELRGWYHKDNNIVILRVGDSMDSEWSAYNWERGLWDVTPEEFNPNTVDLQKEGFEQIRTGDMVNLLF